MAACAACCSTGAPAADDGIDLEQLAIEEAIQFCRALEESKREYEDDVARRHNFTGVRASAHASPKAAAFPTLPASWYIPASSH